LGPTQRLAVFSDSLNSVYMYNTLLASLGYHQLLIDVVKVVLIFDIDFRVFHVSGEVNLVIDHLSYWWAGEAQCISPSLHVFPF
ncbi:uncharacterized protein F5891DRAFT_960750, partial [Suillus fuscotomentosus]